MDKKRKIDLKIIHITFLINFTHKLREFQFKAKKGRGSSPAQHLPY